MSASSAIYWSQATPAFVAASYILSPCSTDIHYIDNTKLQVDETKVFNVSVAFSDLSSAGFKNLITHTLTTERWRISNIVIVNLTGFNAGGDRLISITDGTSTFTAIPAASLKVGSKQAAWGSADVPFSAVPSDMLQPTVAASNLKAIYSGGTTDYTSGDINFTITAMRTA